MEPSSRTNTLEQVRDQDHEASKLMGRQTVTQKNPNGSDSERASAKRIASRRRRWIPRFPLALLSPWLLHISAIILQLAALVAIAAVLATWKDLPISQWPLLISINSLIALFGFTFEACVLYLASESLGQLKWIYFGRSRPLRNFDIFDRASRGWLGSIHLLWRIALRFPVAAIGALLILLSAATNPFLQQLVVYESCEIVSKTLSASSFRANYWTDMGYHEGAGISVCSLDVTSSIASGMFNLDPTPPVDCPTGNCTIAKPYHTVGFCSACTDVSSQLRFRNITFPKIPENFGVTYLPDGTSSDFVLNEMRGPLVLVANASEYEPSVDILKPYLGNPQWWLGNGTPTLSWTGHGAAAAHCEVYPCIRTYSFNSTLYNETAGAKFNKTSEKLLNSFDITYPSYISRYVTQGPIAHPYVWLEEDCLNAAEKKAVQSKGMPANWSQIQEGWIPYPFDVNETTGLPPGIRPQCVYMLDYLLSIAAVTPCLAEFMNGNVTMGEDPNLAAVYGPAQLQTLFNQGNSSFALIASAFERMTDSITSLMRVHPAEGDEGMNQPATGVVYVADTCVSIKWAWLALPIVLSASTIVFFALVLVALTHHRHQSRPGSFASMSGGFDPAWATSSLATLFADLDPGIRARLADLPDEQIEKELRQLRVVLRQDSEKGRRFVEEQNDKS